MILQTWKGHISELCALDLHKKVFIVRFHHIENEHIEFVSEIAYSLLDDGQQSLIDSGVVIIMHLKQLENGKLGFLFEFEPFESWTDEEITKAEKNVSELKSLFE